MIIVTGGCGFIGSNLVKKLNEQGHNDIIVVDDLTDGTKFTNLVDCTVSDYLDKDQFRLLVEKNDSSLENIEVIFHQGACSVTTEWNGRYMMETNYDYSKLLLHYTHNKQIPFIYASSAAIYGLSHDSTVHGNNEKPLNVYGYSKLLFDQYVRRHFGNSKNQIVGLRYFNVYGPREQHKGTMASTIFHFNRQLQTSDCVKLFAGCDGYGDGEQRRDFIYVEDICDVNIWFWKNKNKSGIFNVGTGQSRPFNDVATNVIKWHKHGHIEYIPFPEHLRGRYQSFTEGNIQHLREIGYDKPFTSLEDGIKKYLDTVNLK